MTTGDLDNVARRLVDAERLDKAVAMRMRGYHWDEIARACGYPSAAAALRAVGHAMADANARAESTVDMYRDEAELRLGNLLRATLDMLEESAPYDEEGNQPDDRAVRLRAVDEARRIVGDLSKLRGVDKPAPAGDDGVLSIRVVGIDPEDLV